MPPVNILGISAFYHDSAACLVRDGEIIAAAQEERFSRLRHDARFPANAVRYCLEEGGIDGGSLDLIMFHEKPFVHFERLLETYLEYAPEGFRQFRLSMPVWLKQKLWIKEIIRREAGFDGRILFPSHHESHAAAAFFPSPFEDAAILTMDGVGEWATAACGVGEGNGIRLDGQLRFPHSLGLLYSAFTYFTGFKVNSGEYKVMGLAPYGEPRYRNLILQRLMDLREDGSFRLDMEFFDYCAGLTMTSERFHELFGAAPREPGSDLRQVDMDLARSIQDVTEEVVIRMARYVRKQTGRKRLVMAGGVALNSVANGKLQQMGIFDHIWIQPASGDAGSALGAALYGWHQYLGNGRRADGSSDKMKGALLGPRFGDEEIEAALDRFGASYEKMEESDLCGEVSRSISQGKVAGWFQGRMEFGPRALGNRSILADARLPDMQRRLNRKVKFREGFRPFAPSVLLPRSREYFDLTTDSPYMLMVFPVSADRLIQPTSGEASLKGLDRMKVVRSDIPAVTHVDGSARIQTVVADENPRFARLLERFEQGTGCPVLINTSFNLRGEPIVCTPDDAYRCFMRSGTDLLAIGRYLLRKTDQKISRDDPLLADIPGGEISAGRKTLRIFGLSTGAGMLILSIVLYWKLSSGLWKLPVAAGGLLVCSGLGFPGVLAGIYPRWSRTTARIGLWVLGAAMAIGFYGVLVPTAFFARRSGKQFLDRGKDPGRETYWEPVPPGDRTSCEKQY